MALVPPAGWHPLPASNFPPHTLTWFARPVVGPDYNIRLLIRSDGTTSDLNDAWAAITAANMLVSGYRGIHTTRYPVSYGGAPGLLIRGLPGGPDPDAFIMLAHHGALYSVIAPGARLAADQRQALASLRFIQRVGPFPSANPPAPRGPRSYRRNPGGKYVGNTLTLTPQNGLRHGMHTYSLFFRARNYEQWLIGYSVGCAGSRARLVVNIEDTAGHLVDRVLHRKGSATNVRQMEESGVPIRLDVQSRCPNWTVTVSGIRV